MITAYGQLLYSGKVAVGPDIGGEQEPTIFGFSSGLCITNCHQFVAAHRVVVRRAYFDMEPEYRGPNSIVSEFQLEHTTVVI
jgi:hypothetical protein